MVLLIEAIPTVTNPHDYVYSMPNRIILQSGSWRYHYRVLSAGDVCVYYQGDAWTIAQPILHALPYYQQLRFWYEWFETSLYQMMPFLPGITEGTRYTDIIAQLSALFNTNKMIRGRNPSYQWGPTVIKDLIQTVLAYSKSDGRANKSLPLIIGPRIDTVVTADGQVHLSSLLTPNAVIPADKADWLADRVAYSISERLRFRLLYGQSVMLQATSDNAISTKEYTEPFQAGSVRTGCANSSE